MTTNDNIVALEILSNYGKSDKDYLLMHKDIICAVLHFSYNKCDKFRIVSQEHLPPFLQIKNCAKSEVDSWIDSRVILPNRDMYDRIKIMVLDSNYSRFQWAIDNHCLSLSDCYWIKKENESIKWKDINYYDNDFSNDLNDILIDSKISNDNRYKKLVCPGSTVTASLPKTWVLDKGRRLLYKRGNQEIVNENLVSEFLGDMQWNHVQYWVSELYGKQCSVCETMSSNNVELITAYELSHGWKKSNSPVKQFVNELKDKVENFDLDFSRMNLMDYIFANCDRHWNNFGIIRNPDTLDIISLAPLYDNGDTFWYNSPIIGCNIKSLLYGSTELEFCNLEYFDKNKLIYAFNYALQFTDLMKFERDFKDIMRYVVERINSIFK